MFVGLVGRGHDAVAFGVAIEHELLVVLAPRHELEGVPVDDVVFGGHFVGLVYIETNHGTDKRHADLFLPSFFRSAQGNFDGGRLICHEFQQELRVLMPREGIRLLFELLVVEMAASSRPLFPSRCQDDVTTVSQLDTFNWLGGEDYKDSNSNSNEQKWSVTTYL